MRSNKDPILVQADSAQVTYLCESLQQFNRPHTGNDAETSIRIIAKDVQGVLLGGILAEVALGWVEIHVLWVEPDSRGTGLGESLLQACERQALEMGAHSARLDTFDWQAEGFYARQGYECFGRLNDYPPGHERVFMRRKLDLPR